MTVGIRAEVAQAPATKTTIATSTGNSETTIKVENYSAAARFWTFQRENVVDDGHAVTTNYHCLRVYLLFQCSPHLLYSPLVLLLGAAEHRPLDHLFARSLQ